MSNELFIDNTLIQSWIQENRNGIKIQEQLIAEGYSEEVVNKYLEAYRKIKRNKRQFTGFVLMGIGAFLGFVSCVLTIANPFPELYNIILYGLTMFAITIILIGLYFVFE